MKLAFSTAWANGDIAKLHDILPLIDSLEIGTIGDSDYFTSIEDFVIKENFPVTSIHVAAGPFKQEKEAYYTPYFASLDKDVREKDLQLIDLTARWARKLGVGLIIIHAGKIGDDSLKTIYLDLKKQFIREGESNELENMRREMIETRNRLSENHLKNTISGLKKLSARYLNEKHSHRDTQFYYLFSRITFQTIPFSHSTNLPDL